MMITENPIICCIECKGAMEYCFCSCPYCGDITKNCCCNLENSKDTARNLPTMHYSKFGLLNKSKKPSVVNTKDDNWWRLEK